jgi:transposase
MKTLPASTKAQVTYLLRSRKSSRQISKLLDVGKSTVSRIHQKQEQSLPKPSAGRPKMLSRQDRHKIVMAIKTGRCKTAVEVQKEFKTSFDINLTSQTIRGVLKDAGLVAKKKVKKPKLTKKHIKQCLDFAKKYKDWTVADWKKVLWSDETKINRYMSDGIKYCWINPEEGLSEKQIIETVKFGGGNIMVWGCMVWDGPGYISKIDGNMDKGLYVEILDECVKDTLNWYKINEKTFYFQHDNDPKHAAKSTKEYLATKGWRILDWPAQSPDLNPIEHLWQHLKSELSKLPRASRDEDELWNEVSRLYYAIPKEVCQNLIKSMPDRIKAVLKAKGRHTRY